jgi:hypothetical protein
LYIQFIHIVVKDTLNWNTHWNAFHKQMKGSKS